MRIAVLGLGHIGLANAVSLAQIYDVMDMILIQIR